MASTGRPSVLEALEPYIHALPKRLRGTLADISGTLEQADLPTDAAIVAEELESRLRKLRKHAEIAAREADRLLRVLDPRVTLDPDLTHRAIRAAGPQGNVFADVGGNRFLWIVAVAGTGKSQDFNQLRAYVRRVGEWLAVRECIELTLTAIPDLSVQVDVALSRYDENVRRLSDTEIRFTWIAEIIWQSAALEIGTRGVDYPSLKFITPSVVAELFSYLRWSLSHPLSEIVEGDKMLSDACRQLTKELSTEAGSVIGRGFKTLALSALPQQVPFVDFTSVGIPHALPIELREAAFNLEQALFDLIRRLVADPNDRGRLFERIVARSAASVAPDGLFEVDGPLNVRIPNTQDVGEVDFAFSGRNLLLLGEAKAYSTTQESYSVLNTFERQVGSAVKQVVKRISAFEGGSPLTTLSGQVTYRADVPAFGLVVTLHSYASAVWNPRLLDLVGAARPDVLVIPIHQLILVLQSMQDENDFIRYAEFRSLMRAEEAIFRDEADLLLVYLMPSARKSVILASVARRPARARPIFPGFQVPFETACRQLVPRHRREWRNRFYGMAVDVQ